MNTQYDNNGCEIFDVPGCKNAIAREAQRSEQQEPETKFNVRCVRMERARTDYELWFGEQWVSSGLHESPANKVADFFNAALAAERENFAKATKQAAEALADKHAKQLTAERQRRDDLQLAYDELDHKCEGVKQQLLSALEDNKRLAKDYVDSRAIEGCTEKKLLSALAAIEKHNRSWHDDDDERIKVDLSLLHEHDAELRKPLVDLLRKCKRPLLDCLCAGSEGRPKNLALVDRIDALAKVKQ